MYDSKHKQTFRLIKKILASCIYGVKLRIGLMYDSTSRAQNHIVVQKPAVSQGSLLHLLASKREMAARLNGDPLAQA